MAARLGWTSAGASGRDSYDISSTKILTGKSCQVQVGSDTYGATLFQHCPATKYTVLDFAKFSFNTEDRKSSWDVTVQYGKHVPHTKQDLLTGLAHTLKAMS